MGNSRGLFVLSLVILAGCSAQGGTMAPVEDRTAGSSDVNYGSKVIEQPDTVSGSDASTSQPEVKPYVSAPSAPVSAPKSQPSTSKPAKSSSAVNSLVAIADAKIKGGQYDAAANSLERALRYDQKNADLWSKLAEVNLLQSDYAQAETKALKSNALAGSNKALMAKNWRLISKARRLQGDAVGADEAEVRAYQLSR